MANELTITADRRDECLAEFKLHAARALEKCGLLAEGYAKINITEQKAVDTGNLRLNDPPKNGASFNPFC